MDSDAVRTVHLVFKTHLDIGFTDLAARVVDRYLAHYIPKALELARTLRRAGGPERFVWTTGSWLIATALERADPAQRALLEKAIAAGDITWHGLPFTTHSELLDPSLFAHGLSIARHLDQRFGKHTIAAKMTDVPGHTRGIVPLLTAGGIELLHIGVNPASTPPAVPPVFVWRDPDGSDLIVMYHGGSYGADMRVPGLDEAILFALTDDNLGPPTPESVAETFRQARLRFPGAAIVASTMDAFAQSLRGVKDRLPVVTAEIGDTWIHGAGTDPLKVARYRELCRARRHWLASGAISAGDPALARMSDALLLVAEHTWGMDIKTHLADWEHYDAAAFAATRPQPNFQAVEASWAEQRRYIDQAVAAVGGTPLAAEAQARLDALVPSPPSTAGTVTIAHTAAAIETAHYRLRLDPLSGAITQLRRKESGRDWASPDHPLGQFRHQSFSHLDYERFWRQYVVNKRATRSWSLPDQTKPGLERAGAVSRTWVPRLLAASSQRHATGTRVLLEFGWDQPERAQYGVPRRLTIELEFPDAEPALHLTVQWFGKPASRLPEACWLSFVPLTRNPRGWSMEKMGEWISPLDVVRDGNRKLHAVGEGIRYRGPDGWLDIATLDAPLVAPGRPSLLDFNNRQPSLRGGMHVALYNNVWGTNFPMWYEDDARFRFVIREGAEPYSV